MPYVEVTLLEIQRMGDVVPFWCKQHTLEHFQKPPPPHHHQNHPRICYRNLRMFYQNDPVGGGGFCGWEVFCKRYTGLFQRIFLSKLTEKI